VKANAGKGRRVARPWMKAIMFLMLAGLSFYTGYASGADMASGSIGTIADNIKSSFGEIAKLITAAAYVAGFGFAVAAILKFKAHKDNPTQVPVGTPIALLFIAVALIFLPSIFSVGGKTVFASGATAGGVSGVETVSGT